MPSYFEANPAYMPHLEQAVMKALDASAREIKRAAALEIAPYSQGAARAIKIYPSRRDAGGPYVDITIGKGLGNILEFSKQQPRRLKGKGKFPAGTNRGIQQRHEFFNRARDLVVARGLDLRRYL